MIDRADARVADVLARVVAVSIVKARRANEHDTPADDLARVLLITNHTTKVLAELGITRDDAKKLTHELIDDQVNMRGGYGDSAQPVPLTYIANCMQCMTQTDGSADNALQMFTGPGTRKAWIRNHTSETSHIVIQRWEQPSAL